MNSTVNQTPETIRATETKYPHDGYLSVAGRGEYGHWDISDGRRRIYRIRGDKACGFALLADPGVEHPEAGPFDTPYEALTFATRLLIDTSAKAQAS